MKKLKNFTLLQFFIAGILCFAAVYLSEKTLGAVATIPFIIILPALAYGIYRKPLHIIGLTALAGVIFKCAFVSDIPSALIFGITCALYSAFAVLATILIIAFRHNKNKMSAILSCVIFVALIAVYTITNGTVFGNINAEKQNIKFAEETYPEETFTIGSTYFSASDFCYVTEFIFTDSEVYSAKISANDDGTAKVNGYHDYCEARLMRPGVEKLRAFLANYGYEGQDFAVRPDRIDTATLLTTGLNSEDFYDDMCYEIAFYYEFENEESFADKCKEYIAYLPEVFTYRSIKFYGFGDKGNNFKYSLTYQSGNANYEVVPFDKKSFKSYTEDFENQRYWKMIK